MRLGTRCQQLRYTPFVGGVLLPELEEPCLVSQVCNSLVAFQFAFGDEVRLYRHQLSFVVQHRYQEVEGELAVPCAFIYAPVLCQPSTSLFVRTAFPKTDQALGGHRALSIQVICTYWNRSRRPGVVALSFS